MTHSNRATKALRYVSYAVLILLFILSMFDVYLAWITWVFAAYAIYLTVRAIGNGLGCGRCNFLFLTGWFVTVLVFVLTYFRMPPQYHIAAVLIVILDAIMWYAGPFVEHTEEPEIEHTPLAEHAEPNQVSPQQGGGPH